MNDGRTKIAVTLIVIAALSLSPSFAIAGDDASAVGASVHTFFGGFGLSSCSDGRPVSSLAAARVLVVETSELLDLSNQEYDARVRSQACNWVKHDGGVDSVKIEMLSADAAVAAWTYHDELTLKSGEVRSARGAVLQIWKRVEGDWRLTFSKSSSQRN